MTKWEYCLLREHSTQEYWICRSSGEKEKVKGPEVSLASVLARLGAEGWEAVNLSLSWAKEFIGGSYNVWPSTTDGREVLFKRPSQ
jgi:hypothetical protein